jgi:hypothetical protein
LLDRYLSDTQTVITHELDFQPELERQREYLLLALFKEGHPLEISIS